MRRLGSAHTNNSKSLRNMSQQREQTSDRRTNIKISRRSDDQHSNRTEAPRILEQQSWLDSVKLAKPKMGSHRAALHVNRNIGHKFPTSRTTTYFWRWPRFCLYFIANVRVERKCEVIHFRAASTVPLTASKLTLTWQFDENKFWNWNSEF